MFCPKCGKENPVDSVYCNKCSFKLPIIDANDLVTETISERKSVNKNHLLGKKRIAIVITLLTISACSACFIIIKDTSLLQSVFNDSEKSSSVISLESTFTYPSLKSVTNNTKVIVTSGGSRFHSTLRCSTLTNKDSTFEWDFYTVPNKMRTACPYCWSDETYPVPKKPMTIEFLINDSYVYVDEINYFHSYIGCPYFKGNGKKRKYKEIRDEQLKELKKFFEEASDELKKNETFIDTIDNRGKCPSCWDGP